MKTKILHICLCSFFPDNYTYQENLLPKYHKILGYDVEVLASTETFDEFGNRIFADNVGEYINENNIFVKRLPLLRNNSIGKKLRRYRGTYEAIKKCKPNIIFIHGCQFLDIKEVIRYLNDYKDTLVFVDNHADFSNSATNFFSKNILHKLIWKRCAKMICPYANTFYGVLPARVDFLIDMYKLPKDKCKLLVMGADDEMVEKANQEERIIENRIKYSINEEDFVIVTGGKIDYAKKQTLLLMKAVKDIKCEKIKLLIFGSIDNKIKKEFDALVDNKKVFYLGWADAQKSYDYFTLGNIAIFPGRHSVYWEQVAALGMPMIVKDWNGTHHIDLGGNVMYLHNDSADEIRMKILELINNPVMFERMKQVADNGKNNFLYSRIANKSIERN